MTWLYSELLSSPGCFNYSARPTQRDLFQPPPPKNVCWIESEEQYSRLPFGLHTCRLAHRHAVSCVKVKQDTVFSVQLVSRPSHKADGSSSPGTSLAVSSATVYRIQPTGMMRLLNVHDVTNSERLHLLTWEPSFKKKKSHTI